MSTGERRMSGIEELRALRRQVMGEEEPEAGFSFGGLASGVLTDPIGAAATLGLSTIDGAILSPLEAVANLPVINLSKVDEFISRARQGLLTTAERVALQAGMTEDELKSVIATGNFFGMFAPIGASVGIANLAIRGRSILRSARAMRRMGLSTPRMASVAIGRYAVAGDFMTEVAAGAVYGGIFREGSGETLEERATGALEEAAFFGAGRAAISGLTWTARNYMLKRGVAKQGLDAIDGINGMPGRTSETMKDLDAFTNETISTLSELEMIVSSPRAMRLVEEDESAAALLRAIQDAHVSKGFSRGVFTPAEGVNPVQEIGRLKQLFPNLTMQTVKSPITGRSDIYFSYGKGLSRDQISEIKNLGFYKGQQVRHPAGEGVFAGAKNKRQAMAGRATVVDAAGRSRSVKLNEIMPAYASTEPLERTEILENLYARFLTFIEEGDQLIRENGVELTSAQARNAVIKGNLQIDGALRRQGQPPGTVYYPESLGLVNTLTPESAQLYQTGLQTIDDIQRTLSNPEMVEGLGETGVLELQSKLAEAVTLVNEIRAGTAVGIIEEIGENGLTARAHLLPDFQETTLLDKFDEFASINGLSGPDQEALRAGFVNRYVDDAIAQIAEVDPFTADLLDDIVREQIEQGIGDSLESIAMSRGMQLFRSPQNDRFVIRDVMTGAEYFSRSEEKVREALLRVYRESPDLVSNDLPFRNLGVNLTGTRGLDMTTGIIRGRNFENYNLGRLAESFSKPFWSPLTKFFERVESATGFPVMRAFDKIDTALTRAQDNYTQVSSLLKTLEKDAKKISMDPNKISTFYAKIGRDFTPAEIDRMSVGEFLELATEEGFEKAELTVMREFFEISDALTPQLDKVIGGGATGKRYLPKYFAEILPENQGLGVAQDSAGMGATDPFVDWFQQAARSGEVSKFSSDPFVALDRFSQKAFLDEEFYPAVDELRSLLYTRAGDLDPQSRAALAEQTGRSFADNDFVVSESVQKIVGGWANSLVSGNREKYEISVGVLNNLLNRVGVKIDETVMNEMVRLMSTLMYGGTLAFRPIQVIMNTFQNFALGYPRLGNRGLGNAIRKALTMDGFLEARAAGAIRQSNRQRLGEEALIADLTELGIVRMDDNFLGSVIESSMRGLFKVGRWTEENIVRVGMIPFESIDDFNRTLSYHWQKEAAAEKIAQYGGRNNILSNSAVRKEFIEDGLAYFPKNIQDQFMEEFESIGVESALQFLGRQFANNTHYIYGRSLSPSYLQNGWGRLFGMFGTFSMWSIDSMRQALKYSSTKQKIGLAARYAAYWGAVTNLGYQLGVDAQRFLVHNSWLWTGGPVLDTVVEAKGIADAPSANPITIGTGLSTLALSTGMLMMPGYVAFMENRRLLEQQGGRIDPVEHTLGLLYGREANTSINNDPFYTKPLDGPEVEFDVPQIVSEEHRRLYGNPTLRLGPPGGIDPVEMLGDSGLSSGRRMSIEFGR